VLFEPAKGCNRVKFDRIMTVLEHGLAGCELRMFFSDYHVSSVPGDAQVAQSLADGKISLQEWFRDNPRQITYLPTYHRGNCVRNFFQVFIHVEGDGKSSIGMMYRLLRQYAYQPVYDEDYSSDEKRLIMQYIYVHSERYMSDCIHRKDSYPHCLINLVCHKNLPFSRSRLHSIIIPIRYWCKESGCSFCRKLYRIAVYGLDDSFEEEIKESILGWDLWFDSDEHPICLQPEY